MPFPAPVALSEGWLLSEIGRGEFIGRVAIEAEARRTDGSAHFLWDDSDALQLIVDAERGIILRCAAMVGGAEAAVIEVRRVRFDEQLPVNLFALE